MVAYLCVINNPSDSIHLRRIANVPKRGIGERSLENAEMLASSLGISMLELMRNASHYEALAYRRRSLDGGVCENDRGFPRDG